MQDVNTHEDMTRVSILRLSPSISTRRAKISASMPVGGKTDAGQDWVLLRTEVDKLTRTIDLDGPPSHVGFLSHLDVSGQPVLSAYA